MIVSKQRLPTAKEMCFLVFENPDGLVNVVVLPLVYARNQPETRAPFVIIDGLVQHDHGASNVVARRGVRVL